MLKLGADPNVKDEQGKTALHVVSTAQPETHRPEVAGKARPDEKDIHGTPRCIPFLDKAAMIEKLLKNGADPNVKNDFGVSPYMMMLEEERIAQYPKVLQQMLAFKAISAPPTSLAKRCCHMAARLEMADTFDTSSRIASLKVKDANGNNVLHALAARRTCRCC